LASVSQRDAFALLEHMRRARPLQRQHRCRTGNDPGHFSNRAVQGFAAQLGFRLPNIVVSPFARRHYVSHTPMDHTAVIRFVENRFIGSFAHLTPRDAAQPDLEEFFDFNTVPWATPPAPPSPVTPASLGRDPCQPTNIGQPAPALDQRRRERPGRDGDADRQDRRAHAGD
jgi:phospholipase C